MNQKEKYYAGVAARAIREISSSVESWTSFLTTMGKNYDFNYPDQVMIHAQRPNATLCMEFDQWKEEKYRYVKRGSKGIALFVTDSERPYLRYVFDVADTGSRRNSRELEKLWKFDDSHRIPIQEAMEKAFGAKKEWNMEMQLQNVAEKLAEEYFSDRRNEMADIVAESFLEGYDELNLEVAFTRAVSTSVAYSLYSRLTDNAEVYFDEEDFRNIFEFNTRKSVNALGTAVSTISTEMFLEIEKTVIAFEQQKRSKGARDMTTQMNYSKVGEYLIPEIQLQNTEAKPLGKYARMRRAFLKENRPMTYNDMILTETLFPHLWEVDETANKRMEVLMNQLLEKNPAPSKKEKQMSWVQHMNALKVQAEEVIMTELINN